MTPSAPASGRPRPRIAAKPSRHASVAQQLDFLTFQELHATNCGSLRIHYYDEMTGRAKIVTIDLGPFLRDEGVVIGAPPTDCQLSTASKIDSSCKAHGFVQVTNFGLTPELRDTVFQAACELFSLPESHKLDKLKRITPETNTGYAPYGHESLNRSRPADLKEAYNFSRPELQLNDFVGTPPAFESTALKLWSVLERAARRYALACAVALGLEVDFFTRSLERFDLCTLRLLRGRGRGRGLARRGARASTRWGGLRAREHRGPARALDE